jgi:hypothetical protein
MNTRAIENLREAIALLIDMEADVGGDPDYPTRVEAEQRSAIVSIRYCVEAAVDEIAKVDAALAACGASQ